MVSAGLFARCTGGAFVTSQLFDVKAACDYLKSIGVSGATVNSTRTIFAQIPRVQIGKRHYVSRENLDAWISNRQRRPR